MGRLKLGMVLWMCLLGGLATDGWFNLAAQESNVLSRLRAAQGTDRINLLITAS
jgi:hypothetical protein